MPWATRQLAFRCAAGSESHVHVRVDRTAVKARIWRTPTSKDVAEHLANVSYIRPDDCSIA